MLHTFDGSPPRRIGGRLAPVKLDHAGDQVIRRHAHRLQWLEPGEGEQPLRQLPTAQGRIERIVHQLAGLRAVHRPGTGQAEIGDDHTQKIVEVVRKAAGQGTDRLHLLGLAELLLNADALGDVGHETVPPDAVVIVASTSARNAAASAGSSGIAARIATVMRQT
jgi:hypothetical protein